MSPRYTDPGKILQDIYIPRPPWGDKPIKPSGKMFQCLEPQFLRTMAEPRWWYLVKAYLRLTKKNAYLPRSSHSKISNGLWVIQFFLQAGYRKWVVKTTYWKLKMLLQFLNHYFFLKNSSSTTHQAQKQGTNFQKQMTCRWVGIMRGKVQACIVFIITYNRTIHNTNPAKNYEKMTRGSG